MSRVLVVPDPHLKIEVIDNGIELADKLFCDKVVLLGDYFDDWYATPTDYEDMRVYLKDLLRHSGGRVVPLIGNHELSYLGFPCSGYNRRLEPIVRATVEHDYRFLFGIEIDSVLYSHAGVTSQWIRKHKLIQENDIRCHMGRRNGARMAEKALEKVEKLDLFAEVGRGRGGRSSAPSPVWADMSELLADPLGTFVQVVGHTPVREITHYDNLWFTDVFSNGNESDEYLFVDEGKPKVVHYNELILGETDIYDTEKTELLIG